MSKLWANYLFHTNFTEDRDVISAIPEGTIGDENRQLLVDVLNTRDRGEGKGKWNADEGAEWSIKDAMVLHNGANSQSFATKSKYKSVLILKFPETSKKPVDRIYLQYDL